MDLFETSGDFKFLPILYGFEVSPLFSFSSETKSKIGAFWGFAQHCLFRKGRIWLHELRQLIGSVLELPFCCLSLFCLLRVDVLVSMRLNNGIWHFDDSLGRIRSNMAYSEKERLTLVKWWYWRPPATTSVFDGSYCRDELARHVVDRGCASSRVVHAGCSNEL